MIKNLFKELLFGEGGGLTFDDLSVERKHFSDLLPYTAFDSDKKFYYLKDNSVGWVYECTPLIFAGSIMDSLASIFKTTLPQGTVIQTILYADPHIKDITDEYRNLRYSNMKLNEVYKEQTERYCDFFENAAKKGLKKLAGTPIRHFRLYISIKVPIKAALSKNELLFFQEVKLAKEKIDDIISLLDNAHLNPKLMEPDAFLTILSRLFNPDIEPFQKKWDDRVPLYKQIINGETEIERDGFILKIGSLHARCLTPKRLPKYVDSSLFNNMLGYFGVSSKSIDDDMNQIRSPFIFSASFVYDNLQGYLDLRATQVDVQQARGTFTAGIMARRQEMQWMKSEVDGDNREVFLRAVVTLWLFDKDELALSENINRVASMWTMLNVECQKERSFILPKLFVSSLPLGFYGKDYKDLERDFIVSSRAAAHFMTIQAGCIGMGKPYMLFIDRRGQLMSLDILYTNANKNFCITGGSGAGKSFFGNYLLNSYLSIMAKVRVIDVGGSYKKLNQMFDGQYIEFQGSNLVINFFEGIGKLDEKDEQSDDYGDKLQMLTSIVATMALSRSGALATDQQLTLIELAIDTIYKAKADNTSIDDIANYLGNFQATEVKHEEMAKQAYFLSLALQKFTTKGEYGKYFNGKSNVSFSNDFVVVELEGVAEDLKRVVVLAFASMMEDELYNGDRKRPSIMLLDEAWQTLQNFSAAKFVEGLYRKSRKYNAGVGVATQSIIDLDPEGTLGSLGPVITSQSNFHFALSDKNFQVAKDKGVLNLSDFEWSYIIGKLPGRSLPKYSEFMIKSFDFATPARLTTDDFTYFVCSSDATDNIFLNYFIKKFMAEDSSLKKDKAMVMAINEAIKVSEYLGGIGEFKHYVNTEFIKQVANV